ncbi:MAG TPA: AIR synthase-related protein, partial [Pyrinomonadaceae bacterium]|nr:AIR synthase-related protein [Pyrinomonadaceae bacterium]
YAVSVLGESTENLVSSGVVPKLDLDLERRVQATCLQAAEAGLLHSAHDCSDGGLAVAVSECCFSSLGRDAIGADLDLGAGFDSETLLFSESPSRIIVTFDPADEASVQRLAEANAAPFIIIGRVGGKRLTVTVAGERIVDADITQLETIWRGGLTNKLQAEALAAG